MGHTYAQAGCKKTENLTVCNKQRQRFCWMDNALCSARRDSNCVNGFGGWMTCGVSPDVARLQTAKNFNFREFRHKEGQS
ncbi:MAG: hypothetical protein DRR08_05240 [Candidatus Parabeggiatoa sp. nov. 2]|nr:MAG: hypothetical protein B6247_18350 [Beggiatoa sp. 4572_84]RKZ62772.1 MAG: hypothetical protein DRR08_05240 [Gammaproteobacteria bacterium]